MKASRKITQGKVFAVAILAITLFVQAAIVAGFLGHDKVAIALICIPGVAGIWMFFYALYVVVRSLWEL